MGNSYPRPRALPPVILLLLVLNGLIFLVQQRFPYLLEFNFALWPLGGPFEYIEGNPRFTTEFRFWQMVSYSFLHGSVLHLFSNLFALWMFGRHLENLWGSRRFLNYYVVCVLSAAIVQLVVTTAEVHFGNNSPASTIGASGGVFGILLAFAMMYPQQRLILVVPPMVIKAKTFVILYGIFELFAGITGTFAKLAHFAHLGGMIGGYVIIKYWIRTRLRSQ